MTDGPWKYQSGKMRSILLVVMSDKWTTKTSLSYLRNEYRRSDIILQRLFTQELVVNEHLFDHKSISPVNSESDHLIALGVMVDYKTHIISNILVGGWASIINNILKDDVIVSIDHSDRETTYRTGISKKCSWELTLSSRSVWRDRQLGMWMKSSSVAWTSEDWLIRQECLRSLVNGLIVPCTIPTEKQRVICSK
jgi:hypothetical protein